MPDIAMRRNAVARLFDSAVDSAASPHAGLWLSRGFKEWKMDAGRKGEDLHEHVRKAASLPTPEVYRKAYRRWEQVVISAPTIAGWAGRLGGRLFIGLGSASVIETGIGLSRSYGAPLIPGSAQKGLARAYAELQVVDAGAVDILFGKAGARPEESDSGYVTFHDAWWIPDSADTPLAQELVTAHHPEYYQRAGAQDATDFDSPVPNAQIAARGSFLFAVECGAAAWADFARNLLSSALSDWGIGGKTAAGYGRFESDSALNRKLATTRKKVSLDLLSPEQRLRAEIEALNPTDLPQMLGRDRNKTRASWGIEWKNRIALIAEIHGNSVRAWENSQNKNEKKAFKTVFQQNESEI